MTTKSKAFFAAANKAWAELTLAERALDKSVASKDVRQAYAAALAQWQSFWVDD